MTSMFSVIAVLSGAHPAGATPPGAQSTIANANLDMPSAEVTTPSTQNANIPTFAGAQVLYVGGYIYISGVNSILQVTKSSGAESAIAASCDECALTTDGVNVYYAVDTFQGTTIGYFPVGGANAGAAINGSNASIQSFGGWGALTVGPGGYVYGADTYDYGTVIYEFDPSSTYTPALGLGPFSTIYSWPGSYGDYCSIPAMASDASSIWAFVDCPSGSSLDQISVATDQIVQSVPMPGLFTPISELVSDGAFLYGTTYGGVYQINKANGSVVLVAGTNTYGSGLADGIGSQASFSSTSWGATGIASDGAELWVNDFTTSPSWDDELRELQLGTVSVTLDGTPVFPTGGCGCASGEPVNDASGDFYDSHTDLTIPAAGIPLTFSRSYDALVAQCSSSSPPSGAGCPPVDMSSILGAGWSDNLGMNLTSSSATGSTTVSEATGAEVTFENTTAYSWCPSNFTVNGNVWCPSAPRFLYGLTENTGGTWTLVDQSKSPMTYTFTGGSSSAVLTGIEDASGDVLQEGSPGFVPCPSGDTCTAWSSTPAGESSAVDSLVEAFNGSGQLVEVFGARAGDPSVTFSYSGCGETELCSATDPGGTSGLTTTYSYDTGKSAPYNDDLITETPPATGEIENTYDSGGRVTKQLIEDSSGMTEETDFAYSLAAGTSCSSAGPSTTTVTTYPAGTGHPSSIATYNFSNCVAVGQTDPNGLSTLEQYADPTQYSSPPYLVDTPATLVPVTVTDAEGGQTNQTLATTGAPSTAANVTQLTDPLGNSSDYAYTSGNLVWCEVQPAEVANGVTCPSTEPSFPPTAGSTFGMTMSWYDSNGHLLEQMDPLGDATIHVYTSGVSGVPNGLQWCSMDPANFAAYVVAHPSAAYPYACSTYGTYFTGTTTKTFDAAGSVLTTTNPDGDVTTNCYFSESGSGQCAQHAPSGNEPEALYQSTDPDGTTTTYSYNSADQVTQEVVNYGTYSATSVNGYDPSGRLYCTIAPLAYAEGDTTCVASPPTSPPSAGTDPWPGQSITIYDNDGRVLDTVNPRGGVTQYAYDGQGNRYCTVQPTDYAAGTTCPATSSLPLTVTTPTSDPYSGATIDYFDADGRVVQETNPLGGITLTSYDPAGNVAQRTVESNDGTHAPNVVTAYVYDADNRVTSTTVDPGGGTLQSETQQFYDPNGNDYCSVSANATASGSTHYQCPPWQAGWILTSAQSNATSNPHSNPTIPSPTAEYSSSPSSTQANDVTLTFHDQDGNAIQTTNPDVETTVNAYDQDNRVYCSQDATNVAAYLSAHSGAFYPFGCPPLTSLPSTWPPAAGSDPGYTATVYDPAGRTLSVTDPLGDTESSTYEPDGGVLTQTNADGDVTTNCYAFEKGSGQCAEATQPGSWDASHTLASSSGNAEQISCPTASFCMAVDSSGKAYTLTVTSSGASWSSGASVSSAALDAVSCASAAFCVAGDANGVVYTYTGTWSGSGSTLDTGKAIESLSCLPGFCAAVDMGGKASTTTNGTSWTTVPLTSGKGSLSVSCVSASFCAATSNSGYAYLYNGSRWSASSSALDANATFMTASCASTTLCVLGDNNGNVYTYNGSSWSAATTLDSGKHVDSVSCAHLTKTCVAVDAAGKAFVDSAGTWGTSTTIHASMALASVSCPLANSCVEIDNADQAATYNGSGWSARVALNSTGSPMGDSISCPSATFCAAVSSVGSNTGDNASIYHGSLWQPANDIDGSRSLKAVSCASVSFCVGVDGSGYAATYTGASHASTDADGSTALVSISCPTTVFCMAGDALGNALSWTPSSGWSGTHLVDGSDGSLTAMSCVSSSFCVAGDALGKVWEYTGSWSSTSATLVANKAVTSIGCVSSSFCGAGTTSDAALYSGGSWSSGWSTTLIDSMKSIFVSCAATTSCLAVDSAGKAESYTGSWGTLSAQLDANGFTSDSCPAALYCQATDSVGQVETDNNGTWSSAANVNDDASLAEVSCPSESFCGAVDGSSANLFVETGAAPAGAAWSSTLPQTAADPAGRTTTTSQYPGGAADVTTTPGGTTSTYLDPMGDVLTTAYGATASGYSTPTTTTATFNQDGSRASMTDASGTTSYNYDASGDLTCAKLAAAAGYTSETEIYGYFTTGALHTVGYPDAGASCTATDPDTATYAYDATGQMASVADWSSNSVTFSHDEDDNVTAQDNPGNANTFSYDAADEMTQAVSSVTSPSCTITQNFAPGLSPTAGSRNADNQLTQYYQQLSGSCTTTTYQRDYAYDLAGRLIYQGTSSSSGCTNESTTGLGCFAADAGGNPIEVTAHDSSGHLDTWSQSFDADGEVLSETPISGSSGATYTYAYDTNGDLTSSISSSSTSTYAYDQLGHMTSAMTSAGTTSYTYNGDGLEASVTPPGASLSQLTWMPSDGPAQLLSDGTDDYLYGPSGTPVEQISVSSGTATFLTYFEPSATMMVTSTAGVMADFTGYDAGGNVSNGTSGSAFGYGGQYEDVNSGLVNLRARFYNSQSGEFTTVDPDLAQTDQPYEYAGDDPVNSSDPSGMDVCPPAESGGCEAPPNDLQTLSGRESYAYHYYTANSSPLLSPVEAAAVIGNCVWESAGYNADEGGGGLCQWGPARYAILQTFSGTSNGTIPSFESQVAFVSYELSGTNSSDNFSIVLGDAQNAILADEPNVQAELDDVTEIFELQYECPSGSTGCDTSTATFSPPIVPNNPAQNQNNDAWTSLPARQYYAIQVYDRFTGAGIPDPVPAILQSATCSSTSNTAVTA